MKQTRWLSKFTHCPKLPDFTLAVSSDKNIIRGLTYHVRIFLGIIYHVRKFLGITYHVRKFLGITYHVRIFLGITYHVRIFLGIIYHVRIFLGITYHVRIFLGKVPGSFTRSIVHISFKRLIAELKLNQPADTCKSIKLTYC